MAVYSFLDLAYDVLKATDRPLTYQEVWEIGKEMGLADKIRTSGKTPWQSLGAQLYVDVRDNEHSRISKAGSRPARFVLKERAANLPTDTIVKIEKEEARKKEKKTDYSERDLHPLLAYFAYANPTFNRGRSIITKTIQHEKSSRTGLSEWIHPDIVGFYLPFEDWDPDVIGFNR
ncbi:MAG: hypothetical protein HUU16_16135, partial [Candidatus Omnitrophica bacterium]|nr:hypothetical protein [Candidatus Omnitrophota bacterium]